MEGFTDINHLLRNYKKKDWFAHIKATSLGLETMSLILKYNVKFIDRVDKALERIICYHPLKIFIGNHLWLTLLLTIIYDTSSYWWRHTHGHDSMAWTFCINCHIQKKTRYLEYESNHGLFEYLTSPEEHFNFYSELFKNACNGGTETLQHLW